MPEIWRAVAALCETPRPEMASLAVALELGALPQASEYTELFVFQLSPYASLYLGAEGMLGGAARDRVAGFWRALGLTPPPEPDHLATLLAFYAGLSEHATQAPDALAQARWQHTRQAFLTEHLLSWLPVYLLSLEQIAPAFYQRWATLLCELLVQEAVTVGPSDVLPLAWRASPMLPDPRQDGADAWLKGLLSPVQSGLILTRRDLQRAARDLQLGSRIGERRFALQALLEQDAAGVLAWLAQEAARQARACQTQLDWWPVIAATWGARADKTANLLQELSLEAK